MKEDSIEKLLKKRYKVIADYPNSSLPVGVIIINGFYKYGSIAGNIDTGNFGLWPHLFKPLEWWQERDVEDLPDYLIYTAYQSRCPIIVKVDAHFCNSNREQNKFGFVDTTGEYRSYSKTTPATEQQYTE